VNLNQANRHTEASLQDPHNHLSEEHHEEPLHNDGWQAAAILAGFWAVGTANH
jgi:hypothetical protein